ncbi:V-type ATP synthase subunit I [Proteiniclasticum sp. BAD-10]|uniref:V-type ATP synthase subunit I n=1 Tax=Proteiniclasticum sediminis TaxID=2804028 RepID=A0A941CQA8_9CLOT|nr:V-type ATPase 116kDa subunit family protein [Proteiniclasticum sediminis]MBR0575346.1 V-type ATP synthase subunit I [Proteiniclasticum sediminis]
MAISKMKLVNIVSDLESLDEVLARFIEMDDFHPEPASKLAGSVHGLTTLYYENPYLKMLNRIKEVEEDMGLVIKKQTVDVKDCDLAQISRFIEKTHDKYDSINSQIKEIEQLIREDEDALIQVKNIENLDVSLDDIFSCRYIVSRVGRLPLDSVTKLQFYNNRPFVWNSFSEDTNYSWGIYMTTNSYEREVDNVFTSLYFERIHIPDFVHGTPEKAKENLQEEIDSLKASVEKLNKEKQSLLERTQERYSLFTAVLEHVSKVFEARRYVLGFGERFAITGFIAASDVKKLEKTFADLPKVEIEVRPAQNDKRLVPPTKLKNSWFSKPFGMFVEMYGVPAYKDIDPTPFVAFTYTMLFGIMFGDLGQGLLLSLLGYLLYRFKGMKLGAVGIRIGLSSALFGLLYGSVFGNEEILTPFYTDILGLPGKPIHVMDPGFTMTLLLAAIAIGSVLIVATIGINIYINFKKQHYAEMVMSHNGIAGLFMYTFVLGGAGLMLGGVFNPFNTLTLILFVAVPLLLMFLKEPIERKLHHEAMFPNGFGGFFTEAFFELFEIILSYITNTMSYMRVAGFVLSHAGMMLVVSSLMEMAGSASPVVFVFGNLFVMALEGLIVGIQVLRLEFYEMFSRYYTGSGIPFKSLKETI